MMGFNARKRSAFHRCWRFLLASDLTLTRPSGDSNTVNAIAIVIDNVAGITSTSTTESTTAIIRISVRTRISTCDGVNDGGNGDEDDDVDNDENENDNDEDIENEKE